MSHFNMLRRRECIVVEGLAARSGFLCSAITRLNQPTSLLAVGQCVLVISFIGYVYFNLTPLSI